MFFCGGGPDGRFGPHVESRFFGGGPDGGFGPHVQSRFFGGGPDGGFGPGVESRLDDAVALLGPSPATTISFCIVLRGPALLGHGMLFGVVPSTSIGLVAASVFRSNWSLRAAARTVASLTDPTGERT